MVLEKGGKAPEWNQMLNFNYSEDCQDIEFKIFDKETFKNDDLVAWGVFKLS